MRVYPEALGQHLKKLKGYYLVFGDEHLIRLEALKAIQQAAAQAGFVEHHQFSTEGGLNWDQVFDCASAMSLFSSQQLISIELDKTDKTITDALLELAQLNNPDTIFIIHGNKLSLQQMKAKWFVAMDGAGINVPTNHPDSKHFPQWMYRRLTQAGLSANKDIVNFMCRNFEGNLLACAQEIEKLSLQFGQQPLTLQDIANNITGHTHFGIFQWLDTLFAGKVNRAQRMLQQLQEEGSDIILLSGTLNNEIKKLLDYQYQLNSGVPFAQLMKNARVWSSKQALIQQALNRLSSQQLEHMLGLCCQLELSIKTQYDQNSWPLLQMICVLFQGKSAQQYDLTAIN
ncbi:DNA polymerase III subunit delta [Motilimonas cestriensis]|uniref:DNA polymerase III subunit delta n=1 Tax=Motilimonas cestriensis TaxID=2742685 RepID=A0ABS8W5K8_9GAMM|nr:DNA polymerase III subunit delta [Motilimonas cestriensis]